MKFAFSTQAVIIKKQTKFLIEIHLRSSCNDDAIHFNSIVIFFASETVHRVLKFV